jgi:hypothetical protein
MQNLKIPQTTAQVTTAVNTTKPRDILSALQKHGWGSGFRTPFADASNKILEDEVTYDMTHY